LQREKDNASSNYVRAVYEARVACRDVELLLPELAKRVGKTAQPFSLKTIGHREMTADQLPVYQGPP
jgi:hypothetical protein